jgi:hypothetical protein
MIINCEPYPEDEGQHDRSRSEEAVADSSSAVLMSGTLAVSPQLRLTTNEDDYTDCPQNDNAPPFDGLCFTPLEFSGIAHFVEAIDGSLTATIDDQARIVKAGKFDEDAEGKIIEGSEYSLKNPETFTGYNELWSVYANKPDYSLIGIESGYQKVKFYLKNKYVTMLLVSFTQPMAQAEFDGCDFSEEERSQSRFTNADILTGMTFTRGDYLFCLKDTSEETCAAAEFKWLDLDANQLVSTRPNNPRTNAWLINNPMTCSEEVIETETQGDRGETRKSIGIPGIKFFAELSNQFKLYADWSHGVNSQQWAEEMGAFGNEPDPDHLEDEEYESPYPIYYYQEEGGEIKEGTSLKVTLDFDVNGMLHAAQLSEDTYDSESIEEILKVIDLLSNSSFHSIAGQEGYNPNEMLSGTVNATIELTGGKNRPE